MQTCRRPSSESEQKQRPWSDRCCRSEGLPHGEGRPLNGRAPTPSQPFVYSKTLKKSTNLDLSLIHVRREIGNDDFICRLLGRRSSSRSRPQLGLDGWAWASVSHNLGFGRATATGTTDTSRTGGNDLQKVGVIRQVEGCKGKMSPHRQEPCPLQILGWNIER